MTKSVRSTVIWTSGSTALTILVGLSDLSANAANSSQDEGVVTTGGQSTGTDAACGGFSYLKFGMFIMVSLKRNNVNKQEKENNKKRTVP